MKYPIRHETHSLEDESITYLLNKLPSEWNANRITSDYGIDFNIEISKDRQLTGLEFIVQLKSSNTEVRNNQDFVKQKLKISTYNYLWRNLRVAILIKYIKEDNEAYWILFKDIVAPNQDNKTFTVQIPLENKLSTINWMEIVTYVHRITNTKLDSVK